jgi:hypothetical protein
LEPQNLRTYPFHDASLNDKLLILKVRARPAFLPAPDDYEGFIEFTAKLRAELPALAAFLQKYEPPEECLGKQRSLVKPWRDPEIVEIVSEDDAVPKLLWIIDEVELLACESPSGAKEFSARSFTSMDLERELLAKDKNGQAAKLLAKISIGYLLREMAKRFPARVQKDGEAHKGITRWLVKPELLKEEKNE